MQARPDDSKMTSIGSTVDVMILSSVKLDLIISFALSAVFAVLELSTYTC